MRIVTLGYAMFAVYNQRAMTETVNSSVTRSYGPPPERVNGIVSSAKSS